MKHIKFEENIDADTSYKRDKPPKKELLVQKKSEDDEFDYENIPETKKWFQEIPDDPPDFKPTAIEQMAAFKTEANSFLHGESLAHETKMSRIGSSDQKWARSLLSKGAMADRVAAATVLIQDSPIHNLSTLQNLVAMVKPAKKKDGLTAIETLTELFIFDLLIPDGKLRKFESRPASELEKMSSGNKEHRKKILLFWIYEDLLKETYGEFIKSLNTFAHDTIEAHKEKAVSAMAKLLMHNPEQEKVLLSNLVNKLGDPSQKVASKVIYHLCQVLYNHPNMKGVVLAEIEKMLFRPNISAKAQYYGVCFLNQFFLDKDDSKIAESLVRVYFSFFKACIKKGEVDSRLMSGILTGVRRCQPFLREEAVQALQTHSHALHRLVHLAGYTVALQALALLFQLQPTDRYYCALYKKLSHPETLTTTHPAMLLSLVFKSLKVDENEARVLAFLKRLLQLAAMSEASRACAILLVVARLSRRRKLPMTSSAQEIKEEPSNVPDKENEKQIEDPNKDGSFNEDNDTVTPEVSKKSAKAVRKKSAEESQHSETEDNVEDQDNSENKKNAKVNGTQTLSGKKTDWFIGDKIDLLNDDDDEVYHDIPLEEDQEDHKKKLKNAMKRKATSKGWLHANTLGTLPTDTADEKTEDTQEDKEDVEKGKEKELQIMIKKQKNMEKVITEYMPLNRNPAYCGAEYSAVTELLLLQNHYHPTVRLFAGKMLSGGFIQYNGDPLKDFSIARFLDRFAFKNPKKDPSKVYDDGAQSAGAVTIRGSHPKFAVRKNYTAVGLKSLPVNSTAYLNEDSTHIPVDERFLYDYLQMKRQLKGEDNSDAESDAGSVDSVEFNSYLDTLTGANKKDSDAESEDEAEMDYMKEMMAHGKLKKSKRKSEKEAEDSEDAEDDGEDEGIPGSGSDAEIDDLSDLDDDDSDLMFSDEEMEDEEEAMLEGKKKGKKTKGGDSDLEFSEDDKDMVKPMKKTGKKGIESMFASAEEFATILEETGTSRKQGTSQAVATNDNANMKQLNWEERRDRWVKGYDDRKGGKFGKKGGNFGKKGGKFGKEGGDFNKKSGKFEKSNKFDKKRKNFGAGGGSKGKKFKK